jgi:hypothetical protein
MLRFGKGARGLALLDAEANVEGELLALIVTVPRATDVCRRPSG